MMSKKLFFVCLMCALSYAVYYTVLSKPSLLSAQELKNKYPISPDASTKPIILWDLHQVVFERSLAHWAYLFITQAQFVSIIRNLNMPTISLMTKFVLRKMKLYNQEITSQELIMQAQNAGNNALVDLIMRISCDYYPNPEVVAIIKELNKQHFVQHVGSNIAGTIFGPFAAQHPELFSLFSHYHVVDGTRLPIAKKPDALFFQRYLADTHQKPENIIFIDDRAANVATAQKENIRGIQFKNSAQLRKDLQTLGIFLP